LRAFWLTGGEKCLHTGKVKWFNNSHGYGFIELKDGKEVFVHYSAIITKEYKKLQEGQDVLFELEDGPKGEHAVKVEVLPAALL
jgi:CspA family cold shock protein